MRRLAALAAVALIAFVAPATAQAPTIDDRVLALEQRVQVLEDDAAEVNARLSDSEGVAAWLEDCFVDAEHVAFVKMRVDGAQRRVMVDRSERKLAGGRWMALVERRCIR